MAVPWLDGCWDSRYGYHMPATNQKTTVYLDATEYRRLKSLAYRRGCAPALLVREAVAEYVTRHAPRSLPKSIASASSQLHDLATNADAYLAGMGEDDREETAREPRKVPMNRRRTG